MTLKRVDELRAPPVIGKFYLVPTVRYFWDGIESDWPVFGPKHDDAEIIDFPWPHYHHDSRFQSARQFYCFQDRHYDQAIELTARPLHRVKDRTQYGRREPIDTVPHPVPVYKKLLCKREPHKFTLPATIKKGAWPDKIREVYAHACLQTNAAGVRVCPHKGAPVDSILPVDGIITCPLHGLRFDALTGKSVG